MNTKKTEDVKTTEATDPALADVTVPPEAGLPVENVSPEVDEAAADAAAEAAGALGSEPDDTPGEGSEPDEEKQVYAFPSRSRCPRCRAMDTRATSTRGRTQYRECTRGICRQKYHVTGEKV